MLDLVNNSKYTIAYGQPVLLKDEPHRINDTFGAIRNQTEIVSVDCGSVLVIGTGTEIESQDLGVEYEEDAPLVH